MMDRESVIERLPTHRDLRGLGMTHRRRAAEHSIRCVLNAIRADHREPDAWEAHDIVRAIGLLFGVRTYSKLNAKMFLPFHKFGLYRTVRNMHVNYFFAELSVSTRPSLQARTGCSRQSSRPFKTGHSKYKARILRA